MLLLLNMTPQNDVWAKNIGGTGSDFIYDIKVDASVTFILQVLLIVLIVILIQIQLLQL